MPHFLKTSSPREAWQWRQSSRRGEVDPTMKACSVQRCKTTLKRPRPAQPGMVAAAPLLHADFYAVLEILDVWRLLQTMNLVFRYFFCKKNDFILNFSYVYVWIFTHVNAGAHSLKRVLDPQELELQAVMSSLMWVLEIELESSVRAEGALS